MNTFDIIIITIIITITIIFNCSFLECFFTVALLFVDEPERWKVSDSLLVVCLSSYVGLAEMQSDVEKMILQSIQRVCDFFIYFFVHNSKPPLTRGVTTFSCKRYNGGIVGLAEMRSDVRDTMA